MKVIETLKQDMKNSLKEMDEKNNKKFEEMNKSFKGTIGNQEKAIKQVMETVQDLKTEIEVMKKTQTDGRLDMEHLGKQTGTTETSITNRIQEIEERISDTEDTIAEINSLIKENNKSNKFLTQNIKEMGGHHENNKSKNNRGRRRRTPAQRHRKYIQQNYRRNLSQPKEERVYENKRNDIL